MRTTKPRHHRAPKKPAPEPVVRPGADPAMRLRALELSVAGASGIISSDDVLSPSDDVISVAEAYLKFLVP